MTRLVWVMVFVRVVVIVSPVTGLTVTLVVVGSVDSVVVFYNTFWCWSAASGGGATASASRRPVGRSSVWEKTGGAGAGAGRGLGLYCLMVTEGCFGCSEAATGVGVATDFTETTRVVPTAAGADAGPGVGATFGADTTLAVFGAAVAEGAGTTGDELNRDEATGRGA